MVGPFACCVRGAPSGGERNAFLPRFCCRGESFLPLDSRHQPHAWLQATASPPPTPTVEALIPFLTQIRICLGEKPGGMNDHETTLQLMWSPNSDVKNSMSYLFWCWDFSCMHAVSLTSIYTTAPTIALERESRDACRRMVEQDHIDSRRHLNSWSFVHHIAAAITSS